MSDKVKLAIISQNQKYTLPRSKDIHEQMRNKMAELESVIWLGQEHFFVALNKQKRHFIFTRAV